MNTPGDDLQHWPFGVIAAVAVLVLFANLAKAGLLG